MCDRKILVNYSMRAPGELALLACGGDWHYHVVQ